MVAGPGRTGTSGIIKRTRMIVKFPKDSESTLSSIACL